MLAFADEYPVTEVWVNLPVREGLVAIGNRIVCIYGSTALGFDNHSWFPDAIFRGFGNQQVGLVVHEFRIVNLGVLVRADLVGIG